MDRDLACYNSTQHSLYDYLDHAPFKLQYEILYKMDVLKSIVSPVLAEEADVKRGEGKEKEKSTMGLGLGSVMIRRVAFIGFTM